MSIVKAKDKKSGITYVYESESYWDKEKKQPRNKRTLIGKLDPETGEIVPTHKKGQKNNAALGNAEADAVIAELKDLLAEKEAIIVCLKSENEALRKEKATLVSQLGALYKKWS